MQTAAALAPPLRKRRTPRRSTAASRLVELTLEPEGPEDRPGPRHSTFDKVPYEEVLAEMKDATLSVRERLVALLKLWTRYRYCYFSRTSSDGIVCAAVAAPSQRVIAQLLQVHEASVSRAITRLLQQGKLHLGEDARLGYLLALKPIPPDARIWVPDKRVAVPFTPLPHDATTPPSHDTSEPPQPNACLAHTQAQLVCAQVELACVCNTRPSPIKERARDLDPVLDPQGRHDQTAAPVEVVSRPTPTGQEAPAPEAPPAPLASQTRAKASVKGTSRRVWLDPAWSLPEALAALELPPDLEALPAHAQARPEDIEDAFTSQGRHPFPLRDLAPLLAQLLTVEQLRCIDSNLKRARRRGDLRDPRAYLLQAARAILTGTSHTAPPRHACTSLRHPGDEAGHEASGEASGEVVVVDATPAPVPGMEELRRWRDGLDEAARRGFDARCYLLRAEIKAHHADTVGSGEEEMEEVVWQVAWGEVVAETA